jgi:endo-1,4-beta-mannosidase
LDTTWAASDWPAALEVLEYLEATGSTCGPQPLTTKRYAAHINYAVALENAGAVETAIEQYHSALAANGRGQEALDALTRLDALPDPTPPTCNPGELAPYIPSSPQSFIQVERDRLVASDRKFVVRGLNYYPRHAPWDRFLTEGNLDEIAKELDLIANAGLNTLRIFLWYEPLFSCAPEEATPVPEAFAKLDALIALASERNLHLIITLNDLPDLHFRPLYTDWAHYDAQTTFIVERYHDELAILAWDLRNEGDLDYGARDGNGRFERETVMAWLTHTAEIVRANDDRHLITAGWWGDATETANVVDILSFHHWTDAAELESRIDVLREQSPKPILIEEIGYSSWEKDGEIFQAEMLTKAISTADQSQVAGWLIWSAFDFASADGLPDSPEYHFGLWRTDLTPKPVLDTLQAE